MKRKNLVVLLVCLLVGVMVTVVVVPMTGLYAAGENYSTAMKYAVDFYDGNKCGPNVSVDNVFDWRGACHTQDGNDVSLDLTGGFHDAGDHVKFGLPQGYSASILGWSLYEFNDVFASAGTKTKLLSTLKYFTDYFLASHPNANTFYYQVGEGDSDHTYWGAPEEQSASRPTKYVANASSAASDVLGETSAALSLMYLNYKDIDSAYANKCLTASKELYNMGISNKGVGNGQSFYQSSSYGDDLAWASIWLYVIEKNTSYLDNAQQFVTVRNKYDNDPLMNKWTMCWDDMYMADFVKLAEICKDSKYTDAVDYNMNYWKSGITTSPGGLKYLSNWGALRFTSSASLIALLTYKRTGDTSLYNLAKSQIDYILGNNPQSISYLIGYGSKYPTHPHHRAANGYTYANGDNAKPAKHLLKGALVGGPDASDNYLDDVNQYQYTEVAIDYNAALVGSLAGMVKYSGDPIVTAQPTATPTTAPTTSPTFEPISTPTTAPTATPTTAPTTSCNCGTVTPSSHVYYFIINKNSQKALGVDPSASAGAKLIQTDRQNWELLPVGGEYYKLLHCNSGKVAEVSGASTSDGASIILWSDNGGTSQQWKIVESSDGDMLVNHNSGKCLDVSNASTAEGAEVIQWPDNKGANQRWYLAAAGVVDPTPTPTQVPTPTPTQEPTPTVEPPTSTPTTGNCTLIYTVGNDWGSGATVSLTIMNSSSSAIDGWTLVFDYAGNQQITNSWCANITQSGKTVTVKNFDWNASIPAGGSVSSIGLNLSYSGSNAKPTSATLNGSNCTVQ